MDDAIDARQNAEDVVVEALMMARCAGLLSTWSHVSVAVVYFSLADYPFFMFGDTPPPALPRQRSRAGALCTRHQLGQRSVGAAAQERRAPIASLCTAPSGAAQRTTWRRRASAVATFA